MFPKGLQKKSRVNKAVYNNIENIGGRGGTEPQDQELDNNKLLRLAKKKLLRGLI